MTGLALPASIQSKRQMALALPTPPVSAPAPPLIPRRRSSNAGGGGARNRNASVSPSPEPEDDDGDDDRDRKSAKKRKTAPTANVDASLKNEYKYSTEISQMMFVFGEVQDPLSETVRLVEDIVRGQIIEIVTRARLLTHLRSSRFLSPEDLIFLIRDDRGKVNRLRTYLSWKDVRKKAKEDEDRGGADVEMDIEEANDKAAKARKPVVKLPWELLTPFSDFLRTLPSQQNRNGGDDEEEDEEDAQAHQDSLKRLRDADEITKRMTKDEYVHYTDCRQASFTYRKARRFRDFVNFAAYLDVKPNDDIVDILGFLSFEMVRSLCVTALEVRDQVEKSGRVPAPSSSVVGVTMSPVKRKAEGLVASPEDDGRRHVPVSLFTAPPSARQALLPSHVLEAFAQIQRQQASNRVGGMRNFRGGMSKGRIALV
ncbi:transcription initiation protein SPT3, partial [Tremellales sp. Uapishka_1]